jgi:CRISPR-associated endonuclease/helicase Cas3
VFIEQGLSLTVALFNILSLEIYCYMTQKHYAHSLKEKPVNEWQPLDEHLINTAKMAKSFAGAFKSGHWAYLAGIWHDLGKYSWEFQERLKGKHGVVDHSTAGARYAVEALSGAGRIIAYTVAGHHGGMPDAKSTDRSCLENRLSSDYTIPDISIPDRTIADHRIASLALSFNQDKGRIGFQTAFFIRMLFSCLVDADFLDTEAFMEAERADLRSDPSKLSELEKSLLKKLADFKADSFINEQRALILNTCLKAADRKPGLFTLDVIPYTSIIEQNAKIFRDIFGKNAVLEHHSNLALEDLELDYDETSSEAYSYRLSMENWNASIIVTTNVQFFESLFANRPSRCRKLHNIVKSVIILDEAQMLPVPYLLPCIETIRELSTNYGCSVVLCTATQPALTAKDDFSSGLPENSVSEIISNPTDLHNVFKRVRLRYEGEISDKTLVERIVENDKILCIVNTRKRAADIFQLLSDLPDMYHLSARMCPAHRTAVLETIKMELKTKKTSRVISTQLVEAGVDIDFPSVYREMAGLDAIAQAAGRCNREGHLDEGEVVVFMPDNGAVPRVFRQAAAAAESVLRRFADPFSPEAIEDYFRQVFWLAGDRLDIKGILRDFESDWVRGNFPFRTVAQKFRLIESEMLTLIVPWNEKAEKLIHRLRHTEFPKQLLRQLQPYSVQIYEKEFKALEGGGALDYIHGCYPVLISKPHFYHDKLGICVDNLVDIPPEDLIV